MEDAPVGRFAEYRRLAAKGGLFLIDGVSPSPAVLLQMQARIAYQIHGLALHAEPTAHPTRTIKRKSSASRWTIAPPHLDEYSQRDPRYLDQLELNDFWYGFPHNGPAIVVRKSIAKVDMALIAHCFRTPIEIWEAWDVELFKFWLARTEAGRDLFEYQDINYLLDYATETTALHYFQMPKELEEAHAKIRAPSTILSPIPSMAAGVVHGFSMPLPAGLINADMMLFEWDGEELYLLSTPMLTERKLRYQDKFRLPHLGRDPGRRSRCFGSRRPAVLPG
jgi:hypothetical protein